MGVGDSLVTFFRLVLGLAVVIVLIYASGIALRALQRGRVMSRARPMMEVRGSLGLGPGRALHIVRVLDRLFVVGATATHVALVAEIDGTSAGEPDASPRGGPGSPGNDRGFREILDAYTRRFSDEGSIEDEGHGAGARR